MKNKEIEAYLLAYFETIQDNGQLMIELPTVIDRIKMAFHDYEPQEKFDDKTMKLYQTIKKTL